MQILREITVWKVAYRQPNHVYLLDGDRVMAYQPWGQGQVVTCSGTVKLDRRGRRFQEVRSRAFDHLLKKAPRSSSVIRVKGSRGDIYEVNVEDNTCTCAGFRFRGGCRHLAQAA